MAISDKTTQCKRSIDKEQSVFISISIKKKAAWPVKNYFYTPQTMIKNVAAVKKFSRLLKFSGL